MFNWTFLSYYARFVSAKVSNYLVNFQLIIGAFLRKKIEFACAKQKSFFVSNILEKNIYTLQNIFLVTALTTTQQPKQT